LRLSGEVIAPRRAWPPPPLWSAPGRSWP